MSISIRTEKPSAATSRPLVFWASLLIWAGLILFGTVFKTQAFELLPRLNEWVSSHFGWLYIYALSFFLLFALAVSMSPMGRYRLGGADAQPEFGRWTWYSMLFSAGMGIGLVFNGVAEPLLQFDAPLVGASRSSEAADFALPVTYFHWGFSAWAGYVVMALAVAWSGYGKQGTFSIRETLRPLFGQTVDGAFGDLVDISATLGTLVGLAASLGLGAQQVATGLSRLGWIENGVSAQIFIILTITVAATLSLLSGLHHGIRRLSEINLSLALLLGLFVFWVGPSWEIVRDFGLHLVEYIGVLWDRGIRYPGQSEAERDWIRRWTIPYWAWWISWAPFVGVFIARISKGRTVRDLIWSAVFIPSLFTFAWFEIFGGTALRMPDTPRDAMADAVGSDLSTSIFVFLEHFPGEQITSILAIVVVTIFFISSSDSASYVVDMLTNGGHPDPPKWQRIFWAAAEGICAATLLYVGGSQALHAVHAIVIAAALPYTLLMILMTVATAKAMWGRRRELGSRV